MIIKIDNTAAKRLPWSLKTVREKIMPFRFADDRQWSTKFKKLLRKLMIMIQSK